MFTNQLMLFFTLLLLLAVIIYIINRKRKKNIKNRIGECAKETIIKNCAAQMLHIMTTEPDSRITKDIVRESNPIVIIYDDFLTEEETDFLISKYNDKAKPSTVVSKDNGYTTNLHVRKSFSHYTEKAENDIIKNIEKRAAEMSGFPESFIEPLQFLKYEPGGYFRPHHDYFADDYTKGEYQRYATFFVYLNDEFEGGTTIFPNIGLEVNPKKGRAIFWFNVNEKGNVNPLTLHSGTDVIDGEKYGLNIWIRNKSFY